MIHDSLTRFARYKGLDPALSAALSWLAAHDLANIPPGRIDIQGDEVFALVQEYLTKPAGQGAWEAHRRYIDVQYIVKGRERVFFAPIKTLHEGEYVPEKDFLPLTGDGPSLVLSAGFFVIFHPEDAHMPGMQIDTAEPVKKVVVKVRIPG